MKATTLIFVLILGFVSKSFAPDSGSNAKLKDRFGNTIVDLDVAKPKSVWGDAKRLESVKSGPAGNLPTTTRQGNDISIVRNTPAIAQASAFEPQKLPTNGNNGIRIDQFPHGERPSIALAIKEYQSFSKMGLDPPAHISVARDPALNMAFIGRTATAEGQIVQSNLNGKTLPVQPAEKFKDIIKMKMKAERRGQGQGNFNFVAGRTGIPDDNGPVKDENGGFRPASTCAENDCLNQHFKKDPNFLQIQNPNQLQQANIPEKRPNFITINQQQWKGSPYYHLSEYCNNCKARRGHESQPYPKSSNDVPDNVGKWIDITPEEIEKYASQAGSAMNTIDDVNGRVNNHIDELGKNWREGTKGAKGKGKGSKNGDPLRGVNNGGVTKRRCKRGTFMCGPDQRTMQGRFSNLRGRFVSPMGQRGQRFNPETPRRPLNIQGGRFSSLRGRFDSPKDQRGQRFNPATARRPSNIQGGRFSSSRRQTLGQGAYSRSGRHSSYNGVQSSRSRGRGNQMRG